MRVLPPCRSSRGVKQLLWGPFRFFKAIHALWGLQEPGVCSSGCLSAWSSGGHSPVASAAEGPPGQGLSWLLCVCVCVYLFLFLVCPLPLSPTLVPSLLYAWHLVREGYLYLTTSGCVSLHTSVKAPGHPAVGQEEVISPEQALRIKPIQLLQEPWLSPFAWGEGGVTPPTLPSWEGLSY